MGAEFIFAVAPKSSFGIEEARWRIGNMPLKDLLEIGDARWGYEPDTEGNSASEIVEYVREGLVEAVDEIMGNPDRTDMGTMTIEDVEYYVAGGMSYGDSPSDAFDFVNLLNMSGVSDDSLWADRP